MSTADADLPETAGQTELSRRSLLRTGASAGGAIAAGGAGAYHAVEESEALALTTAAAIGAVGSYTLAGYFAGRASKSVDRSAEQAEADWDNWVDFYNIAREHSTEDSSVMESFRRDVNTASNMARREGLYTIYEQASSGVDETGTTEAVNEAVDEAYTQIEKGIWNHYAARVQKFDEEMDLVASDSFQTDPSEVVQLWDYASESYRAPTGSMWIGTNDDEEQFSWDALNFDASLEVTLPNGDIHSIPGGWNNLIRSGRRATSVLGLRMASEDLIAGVFDGDSQWDLALSQPTIREPDPSMFDSVNDGEVDFSDFDGRQTFVDYEGFFEMIRELRSEHEASKNEVSTWMDTYYEDAASGDIDLTEMVGNSGLIETAKNASNFREAALALRVFGFPRSETALRLEFEIDGERQQTDAYLAWSLAGDQTLPVGSPVNPESLPGTFYVAYNVEDEDGNVTGDIGEVIEPFTIVGTEDSVENGEVGFEANGTVTTSMDPEQVTGEFEATGDAKQDAEEARQDINIDNSLFGGGGLFGGDGFSLPVILGRIAGVPIWLAGVIAAYVVNLVRN